MKMTLQNLQRIGKIKDHAPAAAEVQRLLAAIDRNVADAGVDSISDETRFEVAYKAMMQCALVAMLATGYRPATNEPGHHQTMIQSLPLTLSVANDAWVVLDALRRQRNAVDQEALDLRPAHQPALHVENESAQARGSRRVRAALQPREPLRPRADLERREPPDGRWRGYEAAELMGPDKASLDIFGLRDETLADSDNLPPPEVIAQEIVDDLETALEQFRQIAEDLRSSGAAT
jgi:hypothetical protein